MKRFSLLAALAMAFAVAGAQDVTKPVVNVEGFNYASEFSQAEAVIVRNNVISSLQGTKRIIVVDMEQQSSVKSEAERRKQAAAMNDGHKVADITQLNANFILKGTLNNINTTQSTGKSLDGKTYTTWRTTLNYSIQLVDPSTGATVSTFSYEASGSSNDGAGSSRDAAINGSAANMSKFIEDAFPVRGTILQVADGDDKKAKTVYINLGTDSGVQKGQKFIVYAVVDIAGEKSEKEIGTLTAQEVMSATRSLCKVNNGGEEILQNLTSKSPMTIKTRAKKGFFSDLGI